MRQRERNSIHNTYMHISEQSCAAKKRRFSSTIRSNCTNTCTWLSLVNTVPLSLPLSFSLLWKLVISKTVRRWCRRLVRKATLVLQLAEIHIYHLLFYRLFTQLKSRVWVTFSWYNSSDSSKVTSWNFQAAFMQLLCIRGERAREREMVYRGHLNSLACAVRAISPHVCQRRSGGGRACHPFLRVVTNSF